VVEAPPCTSLRCSTCSDQVTEAVEKWTGSIGGGECETPKASGGEEFGEEAESSSHPTRVSGGAS
jgi:hypothetical protein